MKDGIREMTEEYERALRAYAVDAGGEAALEQAYALGRRALNAGLGLLDVAAFYQEALRKIVGGLPEEDKRLLDAAMEFFLESLSPLDMAQRSPKAASTPHQTLVEQRERVESEIRRMNDELRQARDAAIQASRAKTAFLASMSHELRTPLNAIIGYAEMLQDDARERRDEEAAADLGKIRSAAHHLLSLINEILKFAKAEAGKLELRLEPVDIRSVIHEAVSTAETLAEQNGNTIEERIAPEIDWCRADEVKLRQVLINLLSNACKFTEHGRITVEVECEGEHILFRVRDTGIGMDEEQMRHLFEEFYQAHNRSGNFSHGGTGLGLAISRRYVQMMGGTISVQSSPGQGSTFTVHLPFKQDSELSEAH